MVGEEHQTPSEDSVRPLIELRDVSIGYGKARRRRRAFGGPRGLATPAAAARRVEHPDPDPAADGGDGLVVRDVDLVLAEGETVGLVGESGSGKSTVALACLGLLAPRSGTLEVLGRSWSDLSRRQVQALRADVQAVFQDPHRSLDPRQRTDRGLNELRALHGERTSWASNEEIMARVGLDAGLLMRFPHQLSGGQAQRVAIARALLLRPRVLVADEATSALDVSVQAQILRLLREVRDDYGVSVLMISHDLAVVRQTCDRIYVMESGRVVEDGDSEVVLSDPRHRYTRHLVACVPGAVTEHADQGTAA